MAVQPMKKTSKVEMDEIIGTMKTIVVDVPKEEIKAAADALEEALNSPNKPENTDNTQNTDISRPHVYAGIVQVMAAMAKVGIGKDRTAQTGGQGSYKFRGIDDIYNALSQELAKANIVILPKVVERHVVERQSAKGNALFYVTLMVDFTIVSAIDGSAASISTVGEAMDSGDKATNKAMSAAYKYAALMTFCIPTEGDNDSENQTHEVRALATPEPASLEELNPHLVPVPVLASGKGSDWMKWGHTLSTSLKSAGTIEELEAWIKFNFTPLGTAEKDAPKIYKRLNEIAEARQAEIKAMMGGK